MSFLVIHTYSSYNLIHCQLLLYSRPFPLIWMMRHLRVNVLCSGMLVLNIDKYLEVHFSSINLNMRHFWVFLLLVSIRERFLIIICSPMITFIEYDIFICIPPHRKNFAAFTSARLQINIPGFTWFFSPSVCLFSVSNFVGASGLLNKWNFSVFCCKYSCCFCLSLGPVAVPLPRPSPDHLSIACWLVSEFDLLMIFCISFATSWVSLALQFVPKGVELSLPP